MPYKSIQQMKYMHAVHPKIAKRWDKKYDAPKDLPRKVNKDIKGMSVHPVVNCSKSGRSKAIKVSY